METEPCGRRTRREKSGRQAEPAPSGFDSMPTALFLLVALMIADDSSNRTIRGREVVKEKGRGVWETIREVE